MIEGPTLATRMIDLAGQKHPKAKALRTEARILNQALEAFKGPNPSISFAALAFKFKRARALWKDVGGGELV